MGAGCTHLHRAHRMAARGRPRAGTIARSDRARTRATGRPWGTARSGACNDTGAGSESHDAFGPDLDRAVTARLAANLVLMPSILVRVRPRQRPRRDALRRKGCSWWGDRNCLAGLEVRSVNVVSAPRALQGLATGARGAKKCHVFTTHHPIWAIGSYRAGRDVESHSCDLGCY